MRARQQPETAGACVAKLVVLDPGLYAFGLAAAVHGCGPAIEVCSPPRRSGGTLEITDSSGHPAAWLGGSQRVLLVKSPAGGGAALVTAHLAREAGSAPPVVEIRRVSADGTTTAAPSLPPVIMLHLDEPDHAPEAMRPVGFDIVAHIRGRGDVRFADATWVGRLGPGLWIEAFTILSSDPTVAGAIEYKGLNASGAETPWLAGGAACGTRGRGIPLVGFAVRQKASPGGPRFDCEYAGYFQSGTTTGPVRNGAPCLSSRDNDPLEGMRLRIAPRR